MSIKQKQTVLFPKHLNSIPNIQDYPLPKVGRDRRVAFITLEGEPISASVGLSGRRVYRIEDYTAYRDAIGWLIKNQLGGEWDTHRYSFGIRARFFLGNRRKVDIDNLFKPIMDAGTHLVWADDSQIVEIYGVVLREDHNPRIEILIYGIEDFIDYQHSCLYCGKELHGKEGFGKGLTRKFCSVQCHNNAQRKGIERVCEQCGKIFFSGRYTGQPRRVNRRFCGRSCYNLWVKAHSDEMVKRLNK